MYRGRVTTFLQRGWLSPVPFLSRSSGHFGRRRVAAVAVILALGWPAAPALADGGSGTPNGPSFVQGEGLRVLGVTRLDDRDYNVVVLSPDLGRPANVRILLPVGYADHPEARYPVLYLFHGTSGTAADWVVSGGAEATTAPYNLITVMPDCGFNGDGGFFFTNWVDRTTSHGPSQFESYLIDSLIPWVDANLRTVADRNGRAVAGLSQGGYGAAEMAARHPDLFTSMASFSGAPEIERDPQIFAGAVGIIGAIEVGLDHVSPDSEFGDPALDLTNWRGHDPATLLTNLRGMSIDLWTGEGADGPYDSSPTLAGSGIEAATHQSTQSFHQHLVDESIPSYYDDYVYGTHTFPYWARDLRDYVPRMMADFAHPQQPAVISYMSIDRDWSQWGYTVSMDRPQAQQFTALSDGTAAGFQFSGSGTAIISTPAQYDPGAHLDVTVAGPRGTTTEAAEADGSGRLTVTVPLGTDGVARVSINPQPT